MADGWTDRDEFAFRAEATGGHGPIAWIGYPMVDGLRQFADRSRAFVREMLPVIEHIRAVAREQYERAGQPFGEGDDAMWRWVSWQRELEDALPEKFLLTDDEEDAWDEIVEELDDRR